MNRQRRILGLTLREHVGGRWAISWVLFVINIPFNMFSITTNISAQPQEFQWIGWFFVALAGLATIGVFFLIGDFVLFKNRASNPVPVWAVAGFGLLIGAVRGVVVVVTADALGLQGFTTGGLINRMVAGGLLGCVALPLGALVISVISRYRSQRRLLLDELAERQRQRLAEEDELRVLRAAVVEDVRQEVRDVALATIESGGGPKEVSAALRKASHSIWVEEQDPRDRESQATKITSVLWAEATSRGLPIAWICGLWGLSAVASVVSFNGLLLGGAQAVFGVTALALCLWVANVWITRRPSQWAVATISAVLVAWTLTSPVSFVVFDPRMFSTAFPVMVLNLFWLPLVVGMTAIAAGAVSSSELVLDRLRASVDEAEITTRAIEVERDSILRELAEQLHGSVHSPLVAHTALGSDRNRLAEQVGQAVAALGDVGAESTIQVRLEQIAGAWEGLVDLRITVHGGQSRARAVQRVVKEAVANAYRHGSATAVSVQVLERNGQIEVIVEDDGAGITDEVAPGLGSKLFDTLGEWTLASSGNGSVLTMRLRG